MTLAKKRIITILVAFALILSGAAMLSTDYSYAATKKPAKVTGLKYTKSTKNFNKITLKWKKAKNAKTYEVYYKSTDENGKTIWLLDGTAKKTSYTAVQGQLYTEYYKVRAVNGKKKGAFSKSIKVKLPVKKYSGTNVPNYGGLFAWPANLTSSEKIGNETYYYYVDEFGYYDARLYAEDYSTYLLNEDGWTVSEDGTSHVKAGTTVRVDVQEGDDDSGRVIVIIS